MTDHILNDFNYFLIYQALIYGSEHGLREVTHTLGKNVDFAVAGWNIS